MLAGLAGGVGTATSQEVQYYQNSSILPLTGKARVRKIHTLVVETEEHLSKVKWIRSERAARASIVVARKENQSELKEVIVVVPAKWRFVQRIEALRDKTGTDELSELVYNWHFWNIPAYAGLVFGTPTPLAPVETKTFIPKVAGWKVMAEESLRQVATALERLALNQSTQGWARHLKPPDVFKPEGRDAELKLWGDWKFGFLNYVKGLDPSMAASMDMVENNVDANYDIGDMTDETKAKAVRLYSLLTSYVRQRPLKLIRHVKSENGFEAWQNLLKEMQPATRARSLALLSQLSRIQFAEGKTVSEQLPQFEALVLEYERISNQKYSDDAKVASILLACPLQIRQHLHLWLTDTTTYEQLKDRIIQLEAVTTKWDSTNSLMPPTRTTGDEATPMEVDYIGKVGKGKKGLKGKGKDAKGKDKGKEKGKYGGKDGKGAWKGTEKGKSFWDRSSAKKGKPAEKGGKGTKSGACHVCGKTGHFARECWKRVNQVEEQQNPGGASSSSTGPAGSATATASVKMVRLQTPPDASSLEVFDLTTPRGDREDNFPWRVGMVSMELYDVEEFHDVAESEYHDCYEPAVEVPKNVAIVAMDLQDNEEKELSVSMVRRQDYAEEGNCLITVDSGADISVLPKEFAGVGEQQASDGSLMMVDAQGKRIPHNGMTRAKVRMTDRTGKIVEIYEDFALGSVQHPILCAGKLLKRGWSLGEVQGSLHLKHEGRAVNIPLNTERNSLQCEARIFAVQKEEKQKEKTDEEEDAARVQVLQGYLSKYVQELEMTPGWHRLPNGVAVYSDPVATQLVDPTGSIEKLYKARLTLVKGKDGLWEQLEKTEDYSTLGPRAFRRISLTTEPQRTLSFFSPEHFKDYWEPGSEVPLAPYPLTDGAFGHLEWSEDEGEELEELQAQEMYHDVEKMVVAERPHEVELDEVTFSEKMSVKELQMACKERQLAHTGSKKKLLERLVAFKVNLENQMHLAVASKLYNEQRRRPVTLGQPKLPSLAEQELRNVTHWPFASWCQACVASRSKEDKHEKSDNKEDIGKNIIQIDFCYTYTGEEDRSEKPVQDKVVERQDQHGTVLVMTSSETKAIHAVPVPSKGSASLKTITEEIVRFALENSARDACIIQADSERATRQILRSVQQVRNALGMKTEIRLTGAGQHASNGQVERAVQTVRKMANCLRWYAEDKARINIEGGFDIYPWSFKHASFLINRFRVLDGVSRTSFELATGHPYRGKLALFGESVLFKRAVRNKGSAVFEKGVWVTKHPWNDNHVLLSTTGAYESRTIRRLAPEDSFSGPEIFTAKGLPWSYSAQGILMKHAGQAQRYRQPTLEMEASEEELTAIAQDVATGVVTPAPGCQPMTPGITLTTTGPSTGEAPRTPSKAVEKRQLSEEEKSEGERESKKLDASESPRRQAEKRQAEAAEEGEEKKSRAEGSRHLEDERMVAGPEGSPKMSPSHNTGHLYPPHYAGVGAIGVEPHGDEDVDMQLMPEEVLEEQLIGYGGDEGDDPPEVSDEELEVLDKEARNTEIQRMLEMPAMVEVQKSEVEKDEGYIISTKMVMCWKHRLERGGWFRRARLVARQFKNSIDLEATFAPTSMMMLPKMLMHYLLNVRSDFVVVTLDIKDAFLMAAQPATERAYIQTDEHIYKLLRCLPGQRTAASQWFGLFAAACKEFGMQQDLMQPTLMVMENLMYLTVHVDDVFIVGREDKVRELIQHFKEEKRWNVEEKGPFRQGDKFFYLKRQFNLGMRHCDIRCDRKQYDSFEKEVDVYSRFYRKTPFDANFTKKDDSAELEGAEITKYRSIVGRLMYMAGERPDAQYAIQCLARHMSKPTKNALKNAWHTCSYLFGTGGYGVRLEERKKGQSVMDFREIEEVEEAAQHLVEVVTDSDHAGNKNDRRSTTSMQIFIDGNLIDSKVRSQKAIALSSGESEFMALVAGCSEGLLVRHLWNKITGGDCQMKARSDSSAARGMTQRQGIGRVRHIDASMLWIQQKERDKILTVAAIPTDLNSSDIGTKNLPKKRLKGLQYMLHMVDAVGDRVGEQEFREIEEQHKMKQGLKKFGKTKDLRIGLLMLLATINKVGSTPTEKKEPEESDWMWMLLCTFACFGALSLTRGL